MGILDLVFPGKTKFGVAANVFSAHHMIPKISPEIVKQALHDIVERLVDGYASRTPEEAYFTFLDCDRRTQLNIFAQAFDNINISPLLNGEYWTRVRNPMLPTIYDDNAFAAVHGRFFKMYGLRIHLPENPFSSEELSQILSIK